MPWNLTSEISTTIENLVSAETAGLSPVFLYIYLILAIITIGGNGIVIMSYVIDKSIRLSTPNTYIVNLAIADFLVGVFDFLATFIWSISGANLNPLIIPCFLWGWFRHSGTLSSAAVVLLLSWDRYKLVSNALTYKRDQTPRKAALRTFMAWAAVFAFTFVVHIVGVQFYSITAGCIPSEAPSIIIVISFFPEFFFPLLAIVVLNVKVVLALLQRTLSKIEGNFAHKYAPQKKSIFKGNFEGKNFNCTSEEDSKELFKTLNIPQVLDSENILNEETGIKTGAENPGLKDSLETIENIQLESKENLHTEIFNKEWEPDRNDSFDLNSLKCEKLSLDDDKNTRKLDSEKRGIKVLQIPLEAKREMCKLHKAVKALVIFTSIYISCWIPFYVISLVSLIISDMADWVSSFGPLTLVLNSTINPFIYAVMSMKFRRIFLQLLKCDFS